MRHEINQLIKKTLLKEDENMLANEFNETIFVEHDDGSKFEFRHARHRKETMLDRDLTIIFCEHNTVNVFVDIDMVKIKIKPNKGRAYSLKLQRYTPQLKL